MKKNWGVWTEKFFVDDEPGFKFEVYVFGRRSYGVGTKAVWRLPVLGTEKARGARQRKDKGRPGERTKGQKGRAKGKEGDGEGKRREGVRRISKKKWRRRNEEVKKWRRRRRTERRRRCRRQVCRWSGWWNGRRTWDAPGQARPGWAQNQCQTGRAQARELGPGPADWRLGPGHLNTRVFRTFDERGQLTTISDGDLGEHERRMLWNVGCCPRSGSQRRRGSRWEMVRNGTWGLGRDWERKRWCETAKRRKRCGSLRNGAKGAKWCERCEMVRKMGRDGPKTARAKERAKEQRVKSEEWRG